MGHMTAEFIVMNLEGIALAADSAGTLTSSKINNNMNKLYKLAPGHAVGLMIYNHASFMGMPWEIIIKEYREKIKSEQLFENLEDYAIKFIEFLLENKDQFVEKESQSDFVYFLTYQLYRAILNDIWEKYMNWISQNSREMPKSTLISLAAEIN